MRGPRAWQKAPMAALALLSLLSLGCLRPRAKQPDPATQPQEETLSQEAKAFRNQGDAAFLRRDDPLALSEAIKAYGEAAKLDVTDVETRIRLGRAYEIAGWLAKESPETASQVDDLYNAGLTALRQALDLLSPGVAVLLSEGRFQEAFARFGQDDVRAVYQYAALLWRWVGEQGRATQLARRDEVRAAAQKAAELDPSLWGAAPYRLLGEIYAELPSFAGGDLGISRSYFEKAFTLAPNALQNRASCARTYAMRADPSLAVSLWEEVWGADPNLLAPLAPENRLAQRSAELALDQE